MSEANKEELAIIRLLVEQNAEALKLLRLTMDNDEASSARDSERLKEIIAMANSTGIIHLIMDNIRKPRIVETPSEDQAKGA